MKAFAKADRPNGGPAQPSAFLPWPSSAYSLLAASC